MKKLLAVMSILAVSSVAYGEDVVITEQLEGANIEEQIIQDENQDLFLQNIQTELENTKKELEKLKTVAERDAARLKAIKPKWNHEMYFGIEQEIDSDENWKYIKGGVATSPYVGMYLYQDGSKWMYDMQYLKTYLDGQEEYNRNRVSVGARYMTSFKVASGKTGTWGYRIGYRNDSFHWKSMTAGTSTPTYSGYIRKGEERNEIWFRPMFTFNASPKIRLNASFQFRAIDRELDYAKFGTNYAVTKRDWSSIQEHIIGGRYTFANRDFASLEYLFVREDLKRTLLNTEHFAMLRYFHFLPNRDTISPYARIALTRGKQKYYDGLKNVTRTQEKDRSRVGIQYRHIFTPSTNLMFDVYYRPENTYASNGKKSHNQFVLWTMELTHKF